MTSSSIPTATQVIARAREAGVERMLAIGTGDGPPDLEAALRLARQYPVHLRDRGRASARCRESHAPRHSLPLEALAADPKVLAIGEIGLDYHYDFSPRDVQRDVFVEQMKLARRAGKPIVIHTREAWDDTLQLLREHWTGGGIMHCFSGGPRGSAPGAGPRLPSQLRRRADVSESGSPA